MKLETERLILRPIKEEDAESLTKYLNNLNVSKWVATMPYPYTLSDAKDWISIQKKAQVKKTREDYHFMIEPKEERGVIGAIGIFHLEENEEGELGYWLAEPYWRKGYMSEAARRVIKFCEESLNLKRIKIPVFVDNVASNTLAQSLGCRFEGTVKKGAKCLATGETHDENKWVLERD